MSNVSDASDAPVPFKDNGLDLAFPKLDLDDIVKWCRELHDQRKPIRLKSIPGNAPPAERVRLARVIEFDEPTLDDISDLLFTPGGIRTVLDKSLQKAGKVDEGERTSIIRKINPAKAQSLAMDVSGLYEKRPPTTADKQQGGDNPLPGAGEVSGTAATST